MVMKQELKHCDSSPSVCRQEAEVGAVPGLSIWLPLSSTWTRGYEAKVLEPHSHSVALG